MHHGNALKWMKPSTKSPISKSINTAAFMKKPSVHDAATAASQVVSTWLTAKVLPVNPEKDSSGARNS